MTAKALRFLRFLGRLMFTRDGRKQLFHGVEWPTFRFSEVCGIVAFVVILIIGAYVVSQLVLPGVGKYYGYLILFAVASAGGFIAAGITRLLVWMVRAFIAEVNETKR